MEVWQCPAEPALPDLTADADLFTWAADLASAGQGCRDALATAHDIVEGK